MDVNNLTLPEGYQMPFSLEAEQAVLGCVLMDPNCMPQVLIYLRPEYFYLPQHKEIFSVMVSLDALGNKIDPLIILETLKNNGTYDEAAGKNYLFQLAQSVPTTSNVESYAKIVREKYFMRTLITVSQETIDNAVAQTDSADMLLDAAEQRIYDIRQGKTSTGPSKLSDIIVNQVYDTLQKLSSEGAEAFKGISTGYRDLDDVIAGLNKSDLILIGARPAMGKTSFALNIARNVAVKAKKKILFFSLEMTKEQLAQRVRSTEARVLSTKMRTGQLDTDDWTRLGLATASLNDCELYFDDTSTITVAEMKARARRLKNVDCIIIDYLGLIRSGTKVESRVQEVTEITRSLKLMAKDLNIPVICCAQLSRGTEGRGKSHRPQLSDLRESGSIEQDADIVLMLYREEYYKNEKDDPDGDDEPAPTAPVANEVEVIVAKNRHGPTKTVDFIWDADHTLFMGVEKIQNA